MQITTVMVVILIVLCGITLIAHPATRHLPLPTHQLIMAAKCTFARRYAGWLAHMPLLTMLPFVLMLVVFQPLGNGDERAKSRRRRLIARSSIRN